MSSVIKLSFIVVAALKSVRLMPLLFDVCYLFDERIENDDDKSIKKYVQ